jgi:hypothetical protein
MKKEREKAKKEVMGLWKGVKYEVSFYKLDPQENPCKKIYSRNISRTRNDLMSFFCE